MYFLYKIIPLQQGNNVFICCVLIFVLSLYMYFVVFIVYSWLIAHVFWNKLYVVTYCSYGNWLICVVYWTYLCELCHLYINSNHVLVYYMYFLLYRLSLVWYLNVVLMIIIPAQSTYYSCTVFCCGDSNEDLNYISCDCNFFQSLQNWLIKPPTRYRNSYVYNQCLPGNGPFWIFLR